MIQHIQAEDQEAKQHILEFAAQHICNTSSTISWAKLMTSAPFCIYISVAIEDSADTCSIEICNKKLY